MHEGGRREREVSSTGEAENEPGARQTEQTSGVGGDDGGMDQSCVETGCMNYAPWNKVMCLYQSRKEGKNEERKVVQTGRHASTHLACGPDRLSSEAPHVQPGVMFTPCRSARVVRNKTTRIPSKSQSASRRAMTETQRAESRRQTRRMRARDLA